MKKKYKLYKNKKFIAIAVATATLISSATLYQERKKNKIINANTEWNVGYEDIHLLTNFLTNKVTDNNFVLLNIGDHNTDGVYFLKQKLEYCKKNNIDMGLILTSDATTLSDIYLDLEFIKEILTKYTINYPIYIDIDQFYNNPNLTPEEVKFLITTFLKKANDNHLCPGIYGSKNNIDFFKENNELNIEQTIEKNHSTQQIQWISEKNGNINHFLANKKIKNNILNNHENNPKLFREDEYVIYDKSTFDIKELAKDNNLSVTDIKKYNQIISESLSLKQGQVIQIPTKNYQEKNHLTKTPSLGIDVSLWQEEINWEKVNISYAIIQIRDFINDHDDPYFLSNVKGCIKNNIPMGFYIFSRATSINELNKEINYLTKKLENIPVTYPVYIDIETNFWQLNNEEITSNKNFYKTFFQVWGERIKLAGYTPGIYCNENLYQILSNLTDGEIDYLSTWIAGGEYYDQEIDLSKNKLPKIGNQESYSMKQISSLGKINGISNDVDLNYNYLNYQNTKKAPKKYFFRLNNELMIARNIFLSTGGIYITLLMRKKLRKIKKRNKKRGKNN